MIYYEDVISRWYADVKKYCESRGIPDMALKNLRVGDLFDFGLYRAYTEVLFAIKEYRKVPNSPIYAAKLLAAMKQWYIMTANNKAQKITMQLLTGNMFARFVQRKK